MDVGQLVENLPSVRKPWVWSPARHRAGMLIRFRGQPGIQEILSQKVSSIVQGQCCVFYNFSVCMCSFHTDYSPVLCARKQRPQWIIYGTCPRPWASCDSHSVLCSCRSYPPVQVSHTVFRVFNLLVPMSLLKPFMHLQAKWRQYVKCSQPSLKRLISGRWFKTSAGLTGAHRFM